MILTPLIAQQGIDLTDIPVVILCVIALTWVVIRGISHLRGVSSGNPLVMSLTRQETRDMITEALNSSDYARDKQMIALNFQKLEEAQSRCFRAISDTNRTVSDMAHQLTQLHERMLHVKELAEKNSAKVDEILNYHRTTENNKGS